MKKNAGYYILRIFTWPMQLFPLGFHYWLSDILFVFVYYLVGYRKLVVRENLKNSFPEKNEAERKQIEKNFYRGFCDMFVETLYFTHINPQKESKRLSIENLEVVKDLIKKGKNIIWITGHLGNWEFLNLFVNKIAVRIYFVYKKLHNKAFDQFYRDIRSHAGVPLEMRQAFRQLMNDTSEGRQYAALFISDQRPVKSEIKHWITFLNQDTPVMLGTEKIARKTNAAVVYIELSKVKRGYQKVTFELLAEEPSLLEKYKITDRFMQRLEQSIRACPELYLWTHKRWKFKKLQ